MAIEKNISKAPDVHVQPSWLADLGVLFKVRLSSLVLFSTVMAYIAAGGVFEWKTLVYLLVGGALVTFSSSILNHVIERETDLLMIRTQNRPVAQGRISVSSAVLMAGLMSLVGMTLLALINPIAGLLGTLSFILYAFIYTPLKRVSQLSVLVGAIPGALPTAIGAVAASGRIDEFVVFMFLLQFFWQFPHFWGIAWVADEDYKRAGFKMLPGADGAKDSLTGWLSSMFCVALLVLGIIGYIQGTLGVIGGIGITLINSYFLYTAIMHVRDETDASARKMMFASFIHLPVALILILIDQLIG